MTKRGFDDYSPQSSNSHKKMKFSATESSTGSDIYRVIYHEEYNECNTQDP